MNPRGLLTIGGLAAQILWASAYPEKIQPQTAGPSEVAALPASADPLPDDARAYPYYGNTPEEMIPFRGIEPHYRYWVTRLPFRGPGPEYPDPPNLKSQIGRASCRERVWGYV